MPERPEQIPRWIADFKCPRKKSRHGINRLAEQVSKMGLEINAILRAKGLQLERLIVDAQKQPATEHVRHRGNLGAKSLRLWNLGLALNQQVLAMSRKLGHRDLHRFLLLPASESISLRSTLGS